MVSTVSQKRDVTDSLKEAMVTSAHSARVVVPMVLKLRPAKSVAEYGCRAGEWLSVFKSAGVEEVLGIDSPRTEHDNLQIEQTELTQHDLSQPFLANRKFDLALCTGLAETLPESYAERLIENLTNLSSVVLFAAEIPHQGNPHHLNAQWPEYWAKLFASRGYTPIDCIRLPIWQNEEVAPYYSQNLLLYVRQDVLRENAELKDLAKRTNPHQLTFIHPKTYVKNYYLLSEPKVLFVRMIWNAIPTGIRKHLVKPLRDLMWKLIAQ
jgi:hypothetical protein